MTADIPPARPLSWILAFRLARREMRGGLGAFRIFLACLFLGVATIATVGSLSSALVQGMREQGREILGGDVELHLRQRPANAEQLAYLAGQGALSRVTGLRTMAFRDAGVERTVVELKAVDGAYPLYGDIVLEPPRSLATVLGEIDGIWGAAVDETLMTRLGLDLGAVLRVGEVHYQIRGVILHEPDLAADGFNIGPRVMVARSSLPATALIQPGSLIDYRYRLRLPSSVGVDAWRDTLGAQFPEAVWRIRDHTNGAPGMRRFLDRLTLFLTFVGLTSLVVGGLGVANAVHSYLESKVTTIATLKSLGAASRDIFRIYASQVGVLTAVGISAGLVVGAVVPASLGFFLTDKLPVPAAFGIYPAPLLLAAFFGGMTVVIFTVLPLARARLVPTAGLFRNLVEPPASLRPWRAIAIIGAALALLVAVAAFVVERPLHALWSAGGVITVFALLFGLGKGVVKLAGAMPRFRHWTLRMAVSNLRRPGAATVSVVLSLGLGLTLMVAIALIGENLIRQINRELPENAPAFFMLDIQPDQVAGLTALAGADPEIGNLRLVPLLRGRITRVGDIRAEDAAVSADVRWVLRGDRGLTFVDEMPEGNSLVAGRWWPPDYAGPPLISLDHEVAEGLGLTLGDSLTINILGREIEANIVNLRRVDWGRIGFNFTVLFAPGTLETAPHTYIASIDAPLAAEARLFRDITDRFPNFTVVRMRDIFQSIDRILADIGGAVRLVALVTLFASVLVLAGSLAAERRNKIYDAVVLKVLGATRGSLLAAFTIEFMLLGLLSGVIAVVLGAAASYAVVALLMEMDWRFFPGVAAMTLGAGVFVTVVLGLLGTWIALSAKPHMQLRSD